MAALILGVGEPHYQNAILCARTLRAFHPGLPCFIADDRWFGLFSGGAPPSWPGEILSFRAFAGYALAAFFEKILYFDADCYAIGPLDELLACPDEATLTHDAPHYHMRVPDWPRINCGVLCAKKSFWAKWAGIMACTLLPSHDRFTLFDQFLLRQLAATRQIDFSFPPEHEENRFYNIGFRGIDGEWRIHQNLLHKGEAALHVLHLAGYENPSPDSLEPLPRHFIDEILSRNSSPLELHSLGESSIEQSWRPLIDTSQKLPLLKASPWFDDDYEKLGNLYRTPLPFHLEKARPSTSIHPYRRIFDHASSRIFYENIA